MIATSSSDGRAGETADATAQGRWEQKAPLRRVNRFPPLGTRSGEIGFGQEGHGIGGKRAHRRRCAEQQPGKY